MTKAEQQKQKTQARRDFIDEATAKILQSIGEHLVFETSKCAIRMNVSGKNRYFNFERYGEHLRIAVYKSGDIDFRFTEFCHDTVDVRATHYENVTENHDAALEELKKDADMVIDSFLNGYWHGFMDYVCHVGDGDWRVAVRAFQEECKDI